MAVDLLKNFVLSSTGLLDHIVIVVVYEFTPHWVRSFLFTYSLETLFALETFGKLKAFLIGSFLSIGLPLAIVRMFLSFLLGSQIRQDVIFIYTVCILPLGGLFDSLNFVVKGSAIISINSSQHSFVALEFLL